jgi:hypothetical protein
LAHNLANPYFSHEPKARVMTVYFFIKRVKKLVSTDILGCKKLPLPIENVVSTFAKDH